MRHLFLTSILLVGPACARVGGDGSVATTEASGVRARGETRSALHPAGMCAEHGVLEAVCPKCNPALAVVFQAKGDWCAEHGFAESFCPVCYPERGGRPAVEVTAEPLDGAPADGTKIRFKTRETARLAGIETVRAVEAERDETISTVARVVYDGSRVALVSAPMPGVVSNIRADVGARVRRGAPLVVIQSATIAASRSQEQAARSRVANAEASVERQRDLSAAGATSTRAVQDAEQALALAHADLVALQSQLGMVGGGSAGSYTLTAPLSGEITRRDATLGMGVEGGTSLFQIADASRMWVELDIPEADLSRVSVGNDARIVLDTIPDRVFAGEVSYIASAVSVTTRTALARVAIANPDRALRANLYGTGRIAVSGARRTVTVPSAAVQRAKGVDLVFVRTSEDEFVTRRVKVRSRQRDEVRLEEGVQPGEPVVTVGSFLLKTEILKDSIGAGCCDVE